MNTAVPPAFRPARRIAGIGVSEILAIGARAVQLRREGRPVIVLGAGEPDFDTPDNVKDAAVAAIRAGATKYTVLDGTAELKAAVAAKLRRENRLDYAPTEISIGAGAKQVIHNALMATLDDGDEVVIAAPYWTSYADMVAIAGGVPVPVAGREENGFRIEATALEQAITPRTRWLMLNSPSNPTGAAYSPADYRPILDVLLRHPQVWLMSDEIYEHLCYGNFSAVSPVALEPALRERALVVNGVSKSYAMTGWRIGYGAGPEALIRAMAVVQSQSTSNPCSVSQAAAVEALNGPQDFLAERRASFLHRRDLVVEALNAIPGITCRRPEGAFYAFAGCAGVIGRTTPTGAVLSTDMDFCRYLLEEHDVAVVPGSIFGLAPYFRVSYATAEGELRTAMARIARAVEVLR
ncbi:pyridoxal phosphate-dependent aminotransferase [Pseudoroseomonas wenyumeiae]|uniref:Aminotransferase n=1 Tax=Teichococcus wenyumeiae TaxID=2478470 RepID=A0ABX9VF14_9PROT|nr:pyridoxal phosphate-dependent aminotransferase [Pseudoroseomonas wenyumeiae]RMI17272.1 pyridoxal phosphate-dependent aminotransferase [Pseudoroseomonas wenyumeiae]